MLQWNHLEPIQGKEWEQGNVTGLSATRHQQPTTDNTAARLEAVIWILHLFYTNSRSSDPKPRAKDPYLDPDPIHGAAKCEIILSNCYKCGVIGFNPYYYRFF
jgi:hypothetical protein